jgi:sugar lactone lactonase YvrE
MKLPVALALACVAFGQTYTITTVAGSYWGPGDGGSATSATLETPYSVAVDSSGNLYIADYGNESVRRVDAGTGIITTVTPSRIAAFDVKIDSSGTLFISQDEQILKLTPDGKLTAIADANRVSGYNGDEIPAATAAITFPDCLALDAAGNLYFNDRNNQRIREITPDGIIHTIAGTGQAGYNGDGIPAVTAQLNTPRSVAVDASGDIFIVDASNYRLREITPDGIIHTIAGTGVSSFTGDGGPAINATFSSPLAVQVDAYGNLYISDATRVREITPDAIIRTIVGTSIYTFAGDGGPAIAAGIDPHNLATDPAGNLYIADYENSLIRLVAPDGTISTVAGALSFGGDGGPAADAQFCMPWSMTLDTQGNLYVSDTFNHRVRKIDTTGVITTYAGTGLMSTNISSGPATEVNLGNPMGMVVDPSGNLYMIDNWKCRINRITPDGMLQLIAGNSCGYRGDGGPATSALLQNPESLVLDPAGNLYISDTDNNRVRVITPDGMINTFAGTGAAASGADGIPATQSALNHPEGLAMDTAGNLYIADYSSNRVRMVNPAGIITTVAGNGKAGNATDGKLATSQAVTEPTGVAVDNAGNLYITEWGTYYIRKVDPTGILSTIAGTGQWGYSGDNGPARSAGISQTMNPALDAYGNLYFADMNNNCIRELTVNPAPLGIH